MKEAASEVSRRLPVLVGTRARGRARRASPDGRVASPSFSIAVETFYMVDDGFETVYSVVLSNKPKHKHTDAEDQVPG